jgi:hypothetical protein
MRSATEVVEVVGDSQQHSTPESVIEADRREVRADFAKKVKAAVRRDSIYQATTLAGDYRSTSVGQVEAAIDALLKEDAAG